LGERTITSERDIKKGVAALIASCAHMARVHALAGDPPLRRRPPGFEGLTRVIAGQQLSVASAEAIWQRLQARVQPFAVAPFLAVPEEDLRRAGLSAAKISTLHGVAEAIDTGALDLLLVTELSPKEFIYGKLYGVLYNAKEMVAGPILLAG